ncbi:LVIVD repeat-containing protein [Corallococcus carmarthensis]|uniref:LVIVD repeat-containing protein n=1 Tax=Corallococcus carmarthensis TaxID=2316728 RepID=UPI00148BF69E|nr:hypothetical protein [Corallococcus carmarthensis]NOK15901.1 hypothetical protein [Corallococcus carmarthensis]
MTCLPRCLGVMLLTCPVLLMACSETRGTPDAGTPPVAAWDGTATPIEEKGDWIDRGVFAPCEFTPPLGTRIDCDTPALFDVSQCNLVALSKAERHGIYQTELRSASGEYPWAGAGILLPEDGGAGTLNFDPLTRQQFDDQGMFLASIFTTSRGVVTKYALAGCDAPERNHITGCYAFCSNGVLVEKGTFDSERMLWGRGEAESGGGMNLVSESFVGLGFPADVYVTKNHAYVVSIQLKKNMPAGGLSVFDVSDRRHPVLKKVISLPDDGYWNAAWAKDDVLYIATRASGVILYDISNPADPTYLRSVPSGAPLDVHTLFVDGNRLYAMGLRPAQTLIFDITTPQAPVLLNRFTFTSEEFVTSYPHDAFAYEGRLYINHTDIGFLVTDPSDPLQVKELGKYHYNRQYSHASAVGTFAGRTIAFEGGEQEGSHLRVLDVTDPAHIQLIAEHRLRPTTSIHNMILKGTRLYVAWYQEGVHVFDVANPTRPQKIAYFNTYRETDPKRLGIVFEGAIGMRVPGDGYVYVVDTARGLLIFNEP